MTIDFKRLAIAHDNLADAADALQQELMTIYNQVPDLFTTRPAELKLTDKLRLARGLLDFAEKSTPKV